MSTPATHVVKVDWKQVFPWMILFQTFGLSLHVRQIFVGIVAALLIAAGKWLILGREWTHALPLPPLGGPYYSLWPLAPLEDLAISITWLRQAISLLQGPLIVVSTPSLSELTRLVLMFLWTVVVGGLAGGILSRRAAIEFAKEESASLWQTTRYVWKRAIDYVSAPLLPMCGVAVIGTCCLVMGLVVQMVPYSENVLAFIWIGPLLCGILMVCLTVAVFAGWPMMVAAVSINGGDGFDALSRGFGFVLDRWRYFAWCVFLHFLYGNIVMRIVLLAIFWGNVLAGGMVATGLGRQPFDGGPITSSISPWLWLVSLFSMGFAYSFFWSGMTLTYLLLRKSLDNAELTDVYIDESSADPDGLTALLNKNPPTDPPTLLPIIDLPTGR